MISNDEKREMEILDDEKERNRNHEWKKKREIMNINSGEKKRNGIFRWWVWLKWKSEIIIRYREVFK